jgi:hypothetical protein
MLPIKHCQDHNPLTSNSPNTSSTMDFVKNLTGGGNNNNNENQPQATGSEQKSEGGFLGGIGDKLNNAAGGGAEGEKKEDGLDKGEFMFLDQEISENAVF